MAGGAPDAATDGASDDGSFPPGATIGSCVSTKWTTSALASAVADPPVNAVDGVLVSRWSTGVAQTPGQYYQIDFGGYVRLTQIVLDSTGSAGDHPRGYQVETSADGVDFHATTGNISGSVSWLMEGFNIEKSQWVPLFCPNDLWN